MAMDQNTSLPDFQFSQSISSLDTTSPAPYHVNQKSSQCRKMIKNASVGEYLFFESAKFEDGEFGREKVHVMVVSEDEPSYPFTPTIEKKMLNSLARGTKGKIWKQSELKYHEVRYMMNNSNPKDYYTE